MDPLSAHFRGDVTINERKMVGAAREAIRLDPNGSHLHQKIIYLPSPTAAGRSFSRLLDRVWPSQRRARGSRRDSVYADLSWRERVLEINNRQDPHSTQIISWLLHHSTAPITPLALITLRRISHILEGFDVPTVIEGILDLLWRAYESYFQVYVGQSVRAGIIAQYFLARNLFLQFMIQDILRSVENPSGWRTDGHRIGVAWIHAVEHGLGFILPGAKQTVLLPAPRLYLNEDNQFHRETGPAVEWPDGSGLFFRNGVRIPPWIFDFPEQIDSVRIRMEPEIEVRRVMLDIYGRAKFLKDVGAQVQNQTEWGILWYYYNAFTWEWEKMLEVVCPSTGERHYLIVPERLRTARAAVAWTYGVRPRHYQPLVET